MTSKTLIINSSPRINGDTSALIREMKKHLSGEITELSAYRANIAPCLDCRSCQKALGCVIDDDMHVIYADDFVNVVIASPVYYGHFPGPLVNIMSRFQPQYGAKHILNDPMELRRKKGGLILVAGGKGNESGALRPARVLFRLMNATGFEEHTVMSTNTDVQRAAEDAAALDGVKKLAELMNG